MGSVIVGTGMYLPPHVVSNHDMARIMDTTDEWISTRTGVSARHFADRGVGSSDLGVEAGREAMVDAGVSPDDVDILVTATMTPDYMAPGIAGLVQHGLGLSHVASFDLRQQCSGFLYALDLADSMLRAGRGEMALVVGAEVHAGFQPWSDATWLNLFTGEGEISSDEFARNTQFRVWSVLFGDGAGAMVLRRAHESSEGIIATSLHTDGESFELIWVPGVGSKARPYVSATQVNEDRHLPVMDGGGLYRRAVRLMPQAVRTVAGGAGVELDEIDLFIVHQANDRITEGVRKQLGMDPGKVPSNIAGYGNTTAATLPILYHEMRKSGRIEPGTLICFAAFGAGAHYGASLYREPSIA